MHKRQRGVAQALQRIQAFLDAHADRLGGINDSGARRQLDAIAGQLVALESEQDPFGYQRDRDRDRVRALIGRLRLFHMRPIAAIARARLRESPEYAKLRVPPVRVDPGTAVLMAREMARAAEPHAPFFVAMGLPADFRQRLDDAAAAVQDFLHGERLAFTVMAVLVGVLTLWGSSRLTDSRTSEEQH